MTFHVKVLTNDAWDESNHPRANAHAHRGRFVRKATRTGTAVSVKQAVSAALATLRHMPGSARVHPISKSVPSTSSPSPTNAPYHDEACCDLCASGEICDAQRAAMDAKKWDESKHPRGQPGNPGQFASGPSPHPQSKPQQEIHKVATGPGTAAEKEQGIKGVLKKYNAPAGGFAEKFANEWISTLAQGVQQPAPPPPATPTAAPATEHEGSKQVTYGKSNLPSASLNGIPFDHWTAPKTKAAWNAIAEKQKIDEPKPGKDITGAGVIIQEDDGRVWVVHPTNTYGGYSATFPKGGLEKGMSLQSTALKEAYEESGLQVELSSYAGDIQRSTGKARYYFAKRVGGTPMDAGWESENVSLVPVEDLHDVLNVPTDQGMASKFLGATPKPPTKLSEMTKVGGQLGSNPGGKYKDKDGKQWYVKLSKSDNHAKNEMLAAKLYEVAGAPILKPRLFDNGGKLATGTEWQSVTPINRHDPEQRRQAQKNFAVHAWLANWDAAGLEYDNQGTVNGKMATLDPGGSLIYRAMGTPKGNAFGDVVGEWDTLRDPSNKQAHDIFGEMTPKQLKRAAAKVGMVPDSMITSLTMLHGPGDEKQRAALAKRIIARKHDILSKASKIKVPKESSDHAFSIDVNWLDDNGVVYARRSYGDRGEGGTAVGRRITDPTPTPTVPRTQQGGSDPNVARGGGAVKSQSPGFHKAHWAEFHNRISQAAKANPAGASVHVYEPQEYQGMQTYLAPDKSAGFALKGNDIVSVFKHPESPHKNVGYHAVNEAIKQGGDRLDAFDTVLPSFYSNAGFKAVSRVPFNEEFAPEGWDYERMKPFNNGRPDVVFMVHDPEHKQIYHAGEGRIAPDYDTAVQWQHEAAEAIRNRRKRGYGDATLELPPNWTEMDIRDLLAQMVEQNNMKLYFGGIEPTPRHLGQLDPRDLMEETTEDATNYNDPFKAARPLTKLMPTRRRSAFGSTTSTATPGEYKPQAGTYSEIHKEYRQSQGMSDAAHDPETDPFARLDQLRELLRAFKPKYKHSKDTVDIRYVDAPQTRAIPASPQPAAAPQAPRVPRLAKAAPPQPQPRQRGTGETHARVSRTSALVPAHHNREQWPEHIRKLVVPPAWSNVHYNHDPDAALQVVGHDVKGRKQYLYHPKFAASQAEAKFARVKDLEARHEDFIKQNDAMRKHHDPIVREHADAMALVAKMGLRPGGEGDTLAEKQAYGATTLKGRHVVPLKSGTRLRFTGKKGVALDLPVEDPHIASMLNKRALAAGKGGDLFPNVTSRSLLDHIHQFGGFRSKDWRTLHAARSAQQVMGGMVAPENPIQYKKSVREVAKQVSARLGNTATVALQSYIPPVLFSEWRHRAGV